jgi:glycerophosphoryl diester phosphodiesterase
VSERFFDVSTSVYAHRGLWDTAKPENSLTAFDAARAAGIGVELDVRLTADDVPVVFHDAGLERMCGSSTLLPVLIELKVDGIASEIADRVAAAIEGLGGWYGVMSFDEPTVARLCRLVTDRPVGLLVVTDNLPDIATKAMTARALGCDYIGPHHSILPATKAAAGGLPMVTWTVRTPEQLQLARKCGAAPIFEGFSPALAMPGGTPI